MKYIHLAIAGATLLGAFTGRADTLELKDGKLLNGIYEGGSANTVRFRTDQGVQVLPVAFIIALTFDPATRDALAPAALPLPAVAPAPASAPAPAHMALNIPIGTVINVRTVDPISSRDAPGKLFAVTVDAPVTLGEQLMIPAGTRGYGKVLGANQANRAIGSSTLQISLSQLVLEGKTVEIRTDPLGGKGSNSAKKVAGGAALGAGIGAVTGKGNAGKGALIGGALGMALPGETIGVKPNTLLAFTLSAPIILP